MAKTSYFLRWVKRHNPEFLWETTIHPDDDNQRAQEIRHFCAAAKFITLKGHKEQLQTTNHRLCEVLPDTDVFHVALPGFGNNRFINVHAHFISPAKEGHALARQLLHFRTLCTKGHPLTHTEISMVSNGRITLREIISPAKERDDTTWTPQAEPWGEIVMNAAREKGWTAEAPATRHVLTRGLDWLKTRGLNSLFLRPTT